MSRSTPKKVHTVRISDEAWEALQNYAELYGTRGYDKTSVSALLEAIGETRLHIGVGPLRRNTSE